MKKLIFPVLLLLFLSGCSSVETRKTVPANTSHNSVVNESNSNVEKSEETGSIVSTTTSPNALVGENNSEKKLTQLFESTKIPENGLRDSGVYRNYEHKFEFQYPKNVILVDKKIDTNELPVLQLSFLKDYHLKIRVAEDEAANKIIDEENKKTAEAYGENNFMPIMNRTGEFVEINDNKIYLIKNGGEGFFGVGVQAYIQIGSDVIFLQYSADNEYFEKAAKQHDKDVTWSYESERSLLNNEVDNILQSFKFIKN